MKIIPTISYGVFVEQGILLNDHTLDTLNSRLTLFCSLSFSFNELKDASRVTTRRSVKVKIQIQRQKIFIGIYSTNKFKTFFIRKFLSILRKMIKSLFKEILFRQSNNIRSMKLQLNR